MAYQITYTDRFQKHYKSLTAQENECTPGFLLLRGPGAWLEVVRLCSF